MMKNQLTPANQNPNPEGQENCQIALRVRDNGTSDVQTSAQKQMAIASMFVQQLEAAISIPREKWTPGRRIEINIEFELVPTRVFAVVTDNE